MAQRRREFGENPVIASVSFGATRRFQFRHKTKKELRAALDLTHGSLLLMRGETQHHWVHQVPKTAKEVGEPNQPHVPPRPDDHGDGGLIPIRPTFSHGTTRMTGFTSHDLGDGLTFLTGALPSELVWGEARFEEVWRLHPDTKDVIQMIGKPVELPRWQQTYGENYRFSGQTSVALPIPALLVPLLTWATEVVNARLNGLLLNWYEGAGHYIGEHRDSASGLIPGSSIVTLSFGEQRTFRLTRGNGKEKLTRDFAATNGAAFVLPFDTNRVWKHAVPKSARYSGRRISVTIRAFEKGG